MAEVPEDRTVFSWLSEQLHFEEAMRDIPCPFEAGEMLTRPVLCEIDEMVAGAKLAIANYGTYGFLSSDFENTNPAYASQSLTHNPDANHVAPWRSTLGSPVLTRSEHYYGTPETIAKIGKLKGSYYDSYGFRKPTPAATGELGCFTGHLKRSMVRSRLSVIKAGRIESAAFRAGWHRDESVFQNLRLNVPVTAGKEFRLQLMRENRFPVEGDPALTDYIPEVGSIYVWDTHLPHRAAAVCMPSMDRISLVIGVSPWLDYDSDLDAWKPNEFFGKKHPFSMLVDGDIL